MKKALTLLILFAVAGAAEGQVAQTADSLALMGGILVDVEGKQLLEGQVVLVHGGQIQAITNEVDPIPAGYQVIDLEGNYLMPGMIDVHTHLSTLASADIALKSGVTTVRTAGVPAFQDVTLMRLVQDGHLPGPDVVPAGTYITPEIGETALGDHRLGPLMGGVHDAETLREMVRINIDRGAKVIKTRGTERAGRPETDPRKQTYTQEELEAVVDEATKAGVPVMVHAHGDEGGRAAVLAGAKSIEHGTYLTAETLKLMSERGTYLVPTYITLLDLVEPGGDYDNPVILMRGKYMIPKSEQMIRNAIRLGVTIVTGADNRYTEQSTSRVSMEVEHFRRLGLEPWEALRSTTTYAADLLGLGSTTGKIAVGYEADLIVLTDDPIEVPKALQDVVMIMSNGRLVLNRLPFAKD